MKRIVPLVAGVCLLMALFGTPAAAAEEVPPLPHAFYGAVEIDGNPAPVGTEVEAGGEGVETGIEGNPITVTDPGQYGGPGGLDPKLVVQGYIEEGATITFYVDGVPAEPSDPALAKWHSGWVTELNLTVAAAPVEEPAVTTNAATGIGTTKATLNGNLTNPGSASSVDVSFEWGKTTAYGKTATVTASPLSEAGTFSAALSGLSSSTTYHFRAKAVGEGTGYGGDKTFTTTTPSGPPGPPGPPAFSVSGLSVLPAEVEPGETVTIAVSVANTGGESGSYTVVLKIDGVKEAEETVTIAAGESQDVSFSVTREEAGTYTVDVDGLSDSFTVVPVVVLPEPAAFSVSSLSIQPAEVEPGETVTIAVSVANTGGESGSYTVVLKIDEVKEDEERVTVAAGSSRTVSFSVTREEAGSYTVAVDGLSGSFTVLPVVVPPEPAAFSVSSLSVLPAEVEPGETVTIAVSVANTGGESGSYTVILKIDEVKEDEETVTVAAGGSKTVSFSVTKEDPGDYTVDVDGLTGSFTVVLAVKPPGVNWALIGGIIGGLIVVAGLLYYFLVFRRRAY